MFSLELVPREVSLPRGSAFNANASWERRRGLLLVLRDGAGVTGLGEATPLPGFSRERLEDSEAELRGLGRGALLNALQCESAGEALQVLRSLEPLSASARFAVESAVLSVIAQRHQQSLSELLVSLDDGLKLSQASRASCALVDLRRGEPFAGHLSGTIKAKIGIDVEGEVTALAERPAQLTLRLDANRSLPIAAWESLLSRYAQCQPEFIEEPVALAELGSPRPLPTPIAFDESLLNRSRDPAPIEAWLASGQVQALVVKPMLLGGVSACWELWQLGRRHGVPLVLSHLHDGAVAQGIAEQLARVFGSAQLAMGLGERASLRLFANEAQGALGIAVGTLAQ